MARKKIEWTVLVEEIRTHGFKVMSTTDIGAEREVKKLMKAGRHKAQKTEWEVVDVQETYAEEEKVCEEE